MDSFQSAKKTFGNPSQVTGVLPFVKFIENKLRLEDVPLDSMKDVKVVSILGKARMGKSTFLNAMVSKVTQENQTIFATQGGIEHCTYGIDYCFLPEKNLLLLDSQGLANGDARHDPALLLFIYMISDVIIFNDSKILQNEALKLIEPVCAFMTYIEDLDAIVKPSLTFRLSDAELVKDTQKNLDNVMASHPDQYQSIRESITHLFKEPLTLVKTELLDRKEKAMLESGEYLQLMSSPENGFDATIQHVMDVLGASEPRPGIIQRLPQIIDNINTNQKIKIEKLDIVAMVADKDILEWVAEIDPCLYTPINVDGTQKCYDELVEPRKKKRTALMAAFRRRFKGVPDSIREKHLVALASKLNEPILKAVQKCETKAMEIIQPHLQTVNGSRNLPFINSASESFTHMKDEDLKEKYLKPYELLKAACTPVYSKVKEDQEASIQRVYDVFFRGIQECRMVEGDERGAVTNFCEEILETFESKMLQECKEPDAFDKSMLIMKNKDIMDIWLENEIRDLQQFIQVSVTSKSLQYNVDNGILYYSRPKSEYKISHTHDLVADVYTSFTERLNDIAKNSSLLLGALVERKEVLLENRIFTDPALAKTYNLQNPEILFMWDELLLQSMVTLPTTVRVPYMTMRTWHTVYKPMYDTVVGKMVESGYIRANCVPHEGCKSDSLCVLNLQSKDNLRFIETTHAHANDYVKNINGCILRKMRKLYCKMVCKDAAFPSYDPSLQG
jgi:hypothetical protein